MQIPDDIRKCVAFVAYLKDDGSYRLIGTAFQIGKPFPGDPIKMYPYWVTARHLVDKLESNGIFGARQE